MFEIFEDYIRSHIDLSKEQMQLVKSLCTQKRLRRRELLMREGEICRDKVFVAKGLLRSYHRKDDGSEFIIRFAAEESWILDSESYNNRTPSKLNIDALDQSAIICWSRENFEKLYDAIPGFKIYSENLRSNSLDASQNRILINISYTAEQKYQEFVSSFPDVFRRIPLHMVASYLGVSRETLSRIRHAQLKAN